MKAQISVDFIIASIVAVSLFTVVFTIYSTKSRGVGEGLGSIEAQRIGERVAWAVNSVSRGGNGASAEVSLPDGIWGESYYAQIEGRWIEVVWNHGGEESHLSVPLMTNSTKPAKLSPNSVAVIVNRGGVIEVS